MFVFTGPENNTIGVRRGVKAATLAVSLLLSALLTAVALRSPECHWLAWISFLPLLVVVRSLRPRVAAVAGGLWGACLYGFCIGGPAAVVDSVVSAIAGSSAPAVATTAFAIGPSAWLLSLLIVIPAVYVGLAARPTRSRAGIRHGTDTRCGTGILPVSSAISLLTLALGWTLLEAVLHLRNVLGPHDGLLTASQGEGPHLPWFARLLGYVCTAFLVACVNASLAGILGSARLSISACRSLAGSPNAGAWAPSHVVPAIQSWPLRQAQPRAPPVQVAVQK